MNLWQLSASDAAEDVRSGRITARELADACLARTEETDDDIKAWAHLAPDILRGQAEHMDDIRQKGRPVGTLHGVPVGIKDLLDTATMPTAWGSAHLADRQPDANATVINRLYEAGAVVMGKTVTAEMASAASVPTRNPHNHEHTSGGSSAGSAAAVAAGHVPVSIGTQTNGSVIRPASYCGVYGFKPTRGLISRNGCLETSKTLDQIGVFGRTLADVALISDAITGHDPADPATHTRPKPQMHAGVQEKPPVPPAFAWFDLPYADRLEPATHTGLDEVADMLGAQIDRLPCPQSFTEVIDCHRTIHTYEYAQNLRDHPAANADTAADIIAAMIEEGAKVSESDYHHALAMVAGAEEYFEVFFHDYDAILTPAALGEAPKAGDGTGDPICSTIWTFAGLPCLSLPWLVGETGLPVGIQLVAAAEEDARLFRTAAWLERRLANPDETALQETNDNSEHTSAPSPSKETNA